MEFSEKDYTKASLRKICANAGVSTGALYFFFKNKEDLFAAIVEHPFDELKKMLIEHFADENEIPLSKIYEHIKGGHDKLPAALIHQSTRIMTRLCCCSQSHRVRASRARSTRWCI